MSDRMFRRPESYEAEESTRNMLPDFLESRGFSEIADKRQNHGSSISQRIEAISPEGNPVSMQVRLCWRRKKEGPAAALYSAAQLLAKIKDNDWEGSLRDKVARDKAKGATHYLIVQREREAIASAALVPADSILPIWTDQRDLSESLKNQGKLGRRKKNHAMNGSSPTIWLKDEHTPQIGAVLWNFPGVQDVALLEPGFHSSTSTSQVDDTFDDLGAPDYSSMGSDAPSRVTEPKSHVKRDPRVRAAVIKRAGGACERPGCGGARDYPGFLDVHHILGAEKSDRVWNCVALCPNCHREAHMAPSRKEINTSLLAIAERYTA